VSPVCSNGFRSKRTPSLKVLRPNAGIKRRASSSRIPDPTRIALDAASSGLPALRRFALRAFEASPVGMDKASEPGPASTPALLVWRIPAVSPQALSEVCCARRLGLGLSADPRTASIPSGNPAGTMGLVSCLVHMVLNVSSYNTAAISLFFTAREASRPYRPNSVSYYQPTSRAEKTAATGSVQAGSRDRSARCGQVQITRRTSVTPPGCVCRSATESRFPDVQFNSQRDTC